MRGNAIFHIAVALLLLAPGIHAAAGAAGLITSPTSEQTVFLAAFTTLPAMALIIIHHLRRARGAEPPAESAGEIAWMKLFYEKTDEIILVLNEFAQVLSFNQALTRTLMYNREDIIGKPFRHLIHNDYYANTRMNEKILTRLKEVFSGNETSIICSFRKMDDNEPISISLRMIPVMKGNELCNILIIGGAMHSDALTKNYLVRESSNYVLDNNLSQIFLLCHRLTRNLEDRLSKNVILMAQIALQEVLMNSIEHGNLEIDYQKKTALKMQKGNYWEILVSECNQEYFTTRKIHISYYMDRERVEYTIRDEGKGFDWRRHMATEREVIERGLLTDYHGVGLQIVKNVFDIRFNEAGNEVTLTRNLSGLM